MLAVLHWSLSEPDPYSPYTPPQPIPSRSILILFTHLRLVVHSDLFPSGFPTNNIYAFFFSPILDTYYVHLIDLIIPVIFGDEYKLWSSSLCSFLLPPVTSSLFGLILSSAHCSQTPLVYFSPLISETKFCTHTEPEAKFFLYFKSSFYVLDSRREDKRFWTEWWQALPKPNLILLISGWIKFRFITAVPRYLNCAIFSNYLFAILKTRTTFYVSSRMNLFLHIVQSF
jgi:hypothetical protein